MKKPMVVKPFALKHFIYFRPNAAFLNELLKIYLAVELKAGKGMPDEEEILKKEFLPLDKAMKMKKTGKIKDSKTIIAIQAYMLNKR